MTKLTEALISFLLPLLMVRTHSIHSVLTVLVGAALCIYPISVQAEDSATEQEQGNSLRQSLAFEGGYPENVVVGSSVTADTNDMLYAGLNAPNGIFWSDDFAETWHAPTGLVDFGTISDVQTSTTPGTVFMIGGISLYRSQDNGQTWEELTDVQNVAQFMATGSDGLVVVPTRGGEVYVSADDGDTFTAVTVSVIDVAVAPNNLILGLVQGSGDDASLYSLSVDGAVDTGVSGAWIHVATHPVDNNFAVVSGSTEAAYTTTGAVGPFIEMTDPEGLANAQKAVIRPSGRIYLGNDYTDDNGTTWVNASVQNWITFDDVNGYVYTQTDRGVGRSEDNGATYTDKITGMIGVTVNDLAQDSSKEVVWLAAQGGFAKSEDFASSIADGNAPTWEYPILPDITVVSGSTVWVDPDQPDVVIVGATGGVLFRSSDGGDTWTEITDGVDDAAGATFIDFAEFVGDTSTLYASYQSQDSGGGVLQSIDGGATWTNTDMPDVPAGPLAVNADGQVLVGVGVEQTDAAEARGLYLFDGTEWTHISSAADHPTYQALVTGLTFDPETNTVYAVSSGADMEGEVFKSTDDAVWEEWSVVGGDTIPSDFWGQSVVINTHDTDQIYVSTARPSGTGSIYSCSIIKDACEVYYTGLKDETFNTMVFDGLVTGSNTGIFAYQSKAKLTLTKQANKRRLVAGLTDKATNKVLNNRTVRLYRKFKKGGTFKLIETKKIRHGQATFLVNQRGGIFQARWRARKADTDVYTPLTVSSNVTFQ